MHSVVMQACGCWTLCSFCREKLPAWQFLVDWLGVLSKLDREGREGVAPARAMLCTTGIPQVHWTALLAVMQDLALLRFFLLN